MQSYFYMWGTTETNEHWKQKNWTLRDFMFGEKKVTNAFRKKNTVSFLPMHINIGLMKHHVTSLDKRITCLEYIFNSYPGFSTIKIANQEFLIVLMSESLL